ncbi:hypothetical protein ACSBR2_036101 [Camellia fascicularis]
MEGQQSTFGGISWADQWDHNNPDPVYRNNKKGGGSAIDKTKAVASNGVKKVKEGATSGFRWIKIKCQKTDQNH